MRHKSSPSRVEFLLLISSLAVSKMRACTFPWAAVLICQAMLLLLTLLATVPPTTALARNTTEPCAPAACGGLTISYPFWLADTHPPECGYQAFQVACDKQRNASLSNSMWAYHILDIFYENCSFRVANSQLLDGTCEIELNINATSDLGLAPFKISESNQELFFLYNCQKQARQLPRSWAPVNCTSDATNSFAWLAGKYGSDAISTLLPGNYCTVSSMMPVMGYHGATGADYQRLVKGGFLLEYTAEDCDTCTGTGGQCRVNNTMDLFECHCTDGVSPLDCDEFIYG